MSKTTVDLGHSFLLAFELCERVVRRGVFYGLASQIDRDLGLWPTHVFDGSRRDQHAAAIPPVAGCDNPLGNHPRVIVDEQILHCPRL